MTTKTENTIKRKPSEVNLPKDYKKIKLYCYDWSPYTVTGMFVPYKQPVKCGKRWMTTRFCALTTDGTYFSDSKSWLDREKWEYIDDDN